MKQRCTLTFIYLIYKTFALSLKKQTLRCQSDNGRDFCWKSSFWLIFSLTYKLWEFIKAFDDENMSFLCSFVLPDTQMLRQLTLLDDKKSHIFWKWRAHNEKTVTWVSLLKPCIWSESKFKFLCWLAVCYKCVICCILDVCFCWVISECCFAAVFESESEMKEVIITRLCEFSPQVRRRRRIRSFVPLRSVFHCSETGGHMDALQASCFWFSAWKTFSNHQLMDLFGLRFLKKQVCHLPLC